MKLYEVGTFEQHEEGFHSFVKTLDKDKAVFIFEKAKICIENIPELEINISDQDMQKHVEICEEIDRKFTKETGVEFNISMYSRRIYEIQLREFDLV